MATKITRVVTELGTEELEQEIMELFPRASLSSFTAGDICAGLRETGLNFVTEELGEPLTALIEKRTLGLGIADGQSLDEAVVRFFDMRGLTDEESGRVTHYPGDGCDPAHTLPGDDDPNMCRGLPGRD